jgi:predicted urease superfamily metal-dependent hydrolase
MNPGVYRVEFYYWHDNVAEADREDLSHALEDGLNVIANNAVEAIEKAEEYVFRTYDYLDDYDEDGEVLPDNVESPRREVVKFELESVVLVTSTDL